jgi:Ni/Fe-hydrogenase subunit HybB-like protein
MEAAMRKAFFLAALGTLLLAAMVEVVAAGVKTSAVRDHFYAATVRNHFYRAAPASGVAIAIPASMKGFPTELLPQ